MICNNFDPLANDLPTLSMSIRFELASLFTPLIHFLYICLPLIDRVTEAARGNITETFVSLNSLFFFFSPNHSLTFRCSELSDLTHLHFRRDSCALYYQQGILENN